MSVNFGHLWPIQTRMAVGRCHLSLRHHWHRPEADTGDVHCKRRRRRMEGKREVRVSIFRNPF